MILVLSVSFLSTCQQVDPFWTSVEGHYEKILKLGERYEFTDTLDAVVSCEKPFYRGYGIANDSERIDDLRIPVAFLRERVALMVKDGTSLLSSSQRYCAGIGIKERDPKSPLTKYYHYWDVIDLIAGEKIITVTNDELLKWIMEGSDYNISRVSLRVDNAVIRWSPDEKAVYYRIYVTFGAHRQDKGKFGPSGYMIMKTDLETKQHRIVYTARVEPVTFKSGQIGKEEDSIMNFWVCPDGERILTDFLDLKRHIELLNSKRAPDILLISRYSATDIGQRRYFSASGFKAFHGHLTKDDGLIPLRVNMPGGDAQDRRKLKEKIDTAIQSIRDNNKPVEITDISDIIKKDILEIIK